MNTLSAQDAFSCDDASMTLSADAEMQQTHF
jgi:hypothetical protein